MAQVVTTQPGVQTTVIVQQGGAQRDWSSGIFSCFDDIGSCLLGYFCPCILAIRISERLGEGCCFACCCQGAMLALRAKLRTEQNIQVIDNHPKYSDTNVRGKVNLKILKGSLCNDAILLMFCGQCALCQMSRELNAIGR